VTVDHQTAASEVSASRSSTAAATPAITDRLSIISAETAWPSGAAALVRWLRSNPDALADLLHVNIGPTDDELPGFDGTLFAESDGGRVLVVVGLGESDDRQLGALLTRMTATEVRAVVWVVGSPRPEHLATLSWLNRSIDASFYVVRVRAARIGNSNPAPVFDLVLRRPRTGDRLNEPTSPPHPMGRRAEDWGDTTPAEEVAPGS
jgi:hypothetical protein